jgi:hypothetical protein
MGRPNVCQNEHQTRDELLDPWHRGHGFDEMHLECLFWKRFDLESVYVEYYSGNKAKRAPTEWRQTGGIRAHSRPVAAAGKDRFAFGITVCSECMAVVRSTFWTLWTKR